MTAKPLHHAPLNNGPLKQENRKSPARCASCDRSEPEVAFHYRKGRAYSYCKTCRRDDEWQRRHPVGRQCASCGKFKMRDAFDNGASRLPQKCNGCRQAQSDRRQAIRLAAIRYPELTCSCCGVRKHRRAFFNDYSRPDGKHLVCRKCEPELPRHLRAVVIRSAVQKHSQTMPQELRFEDDPAAEAEVGTYRARSATIHMQGSACALSPIIKRGRRT